MGDHARHASVELIGQAFAWWVVWLAWKRRRSFDDLWERGGPLLPRRSQTGLLASERDWPGLSWRYLPGRVTCRDVAASTYEEHLRDATLLDEIHEMVSVERDGDGVALVLRGGIRRVVWL